MKNTQTAKTATACQKTPTTQDRIDSLLPDPRETAKSIHEQAVKLQLEGKTYARAKAMAQAQHSPLPKRIAIGKVDGELVDENGFYIAADATKQEIVRRFNHAEALAEALRAVRDAYQQMFDVMPVAWQTYDHIVTEALARWEAK